MQTKNYNLSLADPISYENIIADTYYFDKHTSFDTFIKDIYRINKLYFDSYKIKVKPEQGKTLIWPAEWTHAHYGSILKSGEKFIITGWIDFKV